MNIEFEFTEGDYSVYSLLFIEDKEENFKIRISPTMEFKINLIILMTNHQIKILKISGKTKFKRIRRKKVIDMILRKLKAKSFVE